MKKVKIVSTFLVDVPDNATPDRVAEAVRDMLLDDGLAEYINPDTIEIL